ncbi:ECF-type sigma factor [uncultured Sphingomonas sp.]|uniref:ECF-type sigma factor n=1 Tax=uncultured Sphingomonas sp. TaxID=158754 RepID=UPI0035CBB7E4
MTSDVSSASEATVPAGEATVPARIDAGFLAAYYQEFRLLARRVLRRSGGAVTIQPTDLAHEAAMRLLSRGVTPINDEAHFLALSARVIRATLIEEIRRRRAAKRDVALLTRWDDHDVAAATVDLEQFDRLLEDYAAIDADGAAVVQLRFYVGLTMAEIAEQLDCSESTALRRWRLARAWLLKELAAG